MTGPNMDAVFARIGYKPHPIQRTFHESKARYKVPACGRRLGKSRMAAAELFVNERANIFQPGKLFWIVGPRYCADEQTEILTRRGWLRFDAVTDRDETLTLNPRTGLAEWQPIESVHVFPGGCEMLSMERRGHSSLTTLDHRWLVGWTGNRSKDGVVTRGERGFRFRRSAELTRPNEYVLCAAPVMDLPTTPKYEDAVVELVAWYWTEGSSYNAGISISQNEGENADRISACLRVLFGPPVDELRTPREPAWRDWTSGSVGGYFRVNRYGAEIFKALATNKVPTHDFVLSLTQAQLELFIDVSVRADGHERHRGSKGRERKVVQRKREPLDVLQMVCQLAGYQSAITYDDDRDMHSLAVYERNRFWPGQDRESKKKVVWYEGDVWCPKTPNGTWLARRNGTVYFTGNTHSAKEFRYFRNALRTLPGRKRGKSLWDECPSKSFNVKQGDMRVRLPWDTEVVALSAQRKDNLIGEGVDGVIVAEAARQEEDIWPEYIQPTLTDRAPNTWAVFPSTPQGFNWYFREFQRGEGKNRDQEWESWNFPSWLNPYLFPGGENDPEILKIKARTPEDVFWQEYGASFRSVVGLVYPEWDDDMHIYEERFGHPYEYNPAWPNYTALDFGFSNPTVVLDVQVDPQGNCYVWREHYLARHSTPQHIAMLQGRPDPNGYSVICGYADAADPSSVEQFSQALWPVNASNDYKDWQRGVDVVKQLLLGADEQPHVFFSRNCPNAIWEMQNYRLKEGRSGINAKEEPRKEKDHAPDAFRYFAMGYFVFGSGGGYTLKDVWGLSDSGSATDSDSGYFTLDDDDVLFNMGMRY